MPTGAIQFHASARIWGYLSGYRPSREDGTCPFTEVVVKAAESRAKPYKLTDSQGLYLLIKPNGSKLWQLKYQFGGKQRTLSIGAYPTISI